VRVEGGEARGAASVQQQQRPQVKPAVHPRANAVAAARNAPAGDALKVPAADDQVARRVVPDMPAADRVAADRVAADRVAADRVDADAVGASEPVVRGPPKQLWLPVKSPRPRYPKP
jgi:hypothetical protein